MLYTKASRMIRTVIRIISLTHTCSYLLGMYIFVFILRKNHTLYDHADFNCVPPYTLVSNCYLVTIFFICIILEKFEFTSHADSQIYSYFVGLALYMSYFYLTIIEKEPRSNEKFA